MTTVLGFSEVPTFGVFAEGILAGLFGLTGLRTMAELEDVGVLAADVLAPLLLNRPAARRIQRLVVLPNWGVLF